MFWNTTSDERLLAPAWPQPSAWNDWPGPHLDGFGLPLVGSLLGLLPREDAVDSLLDSIHQAPPRRG